MSNIFKMSHIMEKFCSYNEFMPLAEKCAQIVNVDQRNICIKLLNMLMKCVDDLRDGPMEGTNRIDDRVLTIWNGLYSMFFLNRCDEHRELLDFAFEIFLSQLQDEDYRRLVNWPAFRNTILESLDKIASLRDSHTPLWSNIWCIAIIIVDREVVAENSLLHRFLSVIEPAMQTNSGPDATGGFVCWQVLLQVFVKNQALSNARLKMIALPLNWNDGIEEATLQTLECKFTVWWMALVHFKGTTKNYEDRLLLPFLRFCFGMIDDIRTLRWPLEGNRPLQRSPDLPLKAAVGLVQMLGPYDGGKTEFVCSNLPRDISLSPIMINCCCQATLIILARIGSPETQPNLVDLAANLWRNLAIHFNDRNMGKDAELILITLEKLRMLAKFVENMDAQYSEKAVELFYLAVLAFVEKCYAFSPTPPRLPVDVQVKMIKIIYKALMPLNALHSQRLLEVSAILDAMCHGGNLQTCEQLVDFINEIDSNVLETELQTDEPNNLPLKLWTKLAKSSADWINGHKNTVSQWNSSTVHSGRVWMTFYGQLMWPLEHRMEQIGSSNFLGTWKHLAQAVVSVDGETQFVRQMGSRFLCTVHLGRYHKKIGLFVAHLIGMFPVESPERDVSRDMLPLLKAARQLMYDETLLENDLKSLAMALEDFEHSLAAGHPLRAMTREICTYRSWQSSMSLSDSGIGTSMSENSSAKRRRTISTDCDDLLKPLNEVPMDELIEYVREKAEASPGFRNNVLAALNLNLDE